MRLVRLIGFFVIEFCCPMLSVSQTTTPASSLLESSMSSNNWSFATTELVALHSYASTANALNAVTVSIDGSPSLYHTNDAVKSTVYVATHYANQRVNATVFSAEFGSVKPSMSATASRNPSKTLSVVASVSKVTPLGNNAIRGITKEYASGVSNCSTVFSNARLLNVNNRQIFMIAMQVFIPVTLLLNIISIGLLLKSRKRAKVHNLLILAICTTNCLIGAIGLPSTLVLIHRHLSQTTCSYELYVQTMNTLLFSLTWILTFLLAIDRSVYHKSPNKYPDIMSKHAFKNMLCAAAFLSCVLPALLSVSSIMDKFYITSFILCIFSIILFFAVMIIFTRAYLHSQSFIQAAIKRHHFVLHGMKQAKHNAMNSYIDREPGKYFIAAFLALFVCFSPLIAVTIMEYIFVFIIKCKDSCIIGIEKQALIQAWSYLAACSNSLVNPVILILRHKRMKRRPDLNNRSRNLNKGGQETTLTRWNRNKVNNDIYISPVSISELGPPREAWS